MATDKKFSDWLASLPVAQVAAGDLLPIVQGGATKQAQAGQPGGLATLDSAGKLAQPRRVLDVQFVRGSFGILSTTAAIPSYVIPDLQVTVADATGRTLLIDWAVRAYADVDTLILANIVYSTDGGATWIEQYGGDGRAAFHALANNHVMLSRPGLLTSQTGQIIIGIAVGNYSGGTATITMYNQHRWLRVVEVDY